MSRMAYTKLMYHIMAPHFRLIGQPLRKNCFPWDNFGLVVLDPILCYRAYEVRREENLERKGVGETSFSCQFINVHFLHTDFGDY